jgi:hypothetical protein
MQQSSRIMQSLRWSLVWLVALAIASIATSLGLGRFLEIRDPEAAALVSPFNTDVQVRVISAAVPAATQSDQLAHLEAQTRQALALNRVDARLFSILGEVKRLQGDDRAARAHIAQSRRLSKTEIYSLERSIVWALEEGRTEDAVSDIDILLRRWPARFEEVARVFPALLSTEAGFSAAVRAINEGAPWRRALFGLLGRTREGLATGERLILDLSKSSSPATPAEISAIIGGHLREKEYQSAYSLFLFTLADDEKKHNGYVYNASFEPVALGRPFDWQVTKQSGVELDLPSRSTSSLAGQGALLRFLNAPLKDIGLQQTLLLPPGEYHLSTIVTGRALKLPKGLFWTLECAGGAEIGRLDLPEGTFEDRRLVTELTVPASGCELQVLKLRTGLIAESWRFRYQGGLSVHDVRIELAKL